MTASPVSPGHIASFIDGHDAPAAPVLQIELDPAGVEVMPSPDRYVLEYSDDLLETVPVTCLVSLSCSQQSVHPQKRIANSRIDRSDFPLYLQQLIHANLGRAS